MIEPLTEQELQEHCLNEARKDLDWCRKAAAMTPFRAGDHVKHVSGETWVLACDQADNDVMPAGWPETLAKATHCRLVRAATDAERLDMLRRVAASRPDRSGDSSRRQRLAALQLKAIEAEPSVAAAPVTELIAGIERAIGREETEIRNLETRNPGMFGQAAQPVPIFDPGPSRYDRAPEDGS